MTPFLKRLLAAAAALSVPATLLGVAYYEGPNVTVTNYGLVGTTTGIGGQCLAVGYNHFLSSQNSAAIGYGLQVYDANSLAVGIYNMSSGSGDLLTVGRGTSQNRANALTVNLDGTVTIPGTAEIGAVSVKGGISNFSGTAPVWWSNPVYGFLKNPAGAGTVNSPANVGQLKHAASRAKLYLDNRLAAAGGAGPAVTAMCQFANSDNFAPLQVGQLKNVAQVFYDRLAQAGFNRETGLFGTALNPYPWTGTTDVQNSAPATVGQLKNGFAFTISDAFLQQDSDADSLPDWWEFSNWLDPYNVETNPDPDGNGVSNLSQYYAGTALFPGLEDSDGDGASNNEEILEGTNPNDRASAPVKICYLGSKVFLGGWPKIPATNPGIWPPADYDYKHSLGGNTLSAHPEVLQSTQPNGYPVPALLAGVLPLSPNFPVRAVPIGNEPEIFFPGILQGEIDDASISGQVERRRYWLRGPLSSENQSRLLHVRIVRKKQYFIPGTMNLGEEISQEVSDEYHPLVIEPGNNFSRPYDILVPMTTTVGQIPEGILTPFSAVITSSSGYEKISATVEPLPLEVMHPKLNSNGTYGPVPVSELHLCRWNSPHDPQANGDLANPSAFPFFDPDQIIIRIRLPHKAGADDTLTVHVSTDGAQDTSYNDEGANIQLFEVDPGIFESMPIAIVADNDDDKWQQGRVAQDGAFNDPTFIGWPGGKLKIKVPDLNNAVIDFPIKKFTHSFKCYKIIAGDLANDANSQTAIDENMRRLKEIYAPLHERVDIETVTSPLITQAELLAMVGSDNKMLSSGAQTLRNKVLSLSLPADAIKIVFVCKPVIIADPLSQLGVSGQNQDYAGRNDIVFCSLSNLGASEYYAKLLGECVSHECGHSLRGLDHTDKDGIFVPGSPLLSGGTLLPRWLLMSRGDINNHIMPQFGPKSGKHWLLRDEEIVHGAPDYPDNKFSKKIP